MNIADILVPTDFSLNSLRALEYAKSLLAPGGEIYLLHVIDTDFVMRLAREGFAEAEVATERLRLKAEARLAEIAAEAKTPEMQLETMVVRGNPFSEILRVADDLDFSLIVLGTRGERSGALEELLFGSTAEKVLRATPIPVVCVPPNWSAA